MPSATVEVLEKKLMNHFKKVNLAILRPYTLIAGAIISIFIFLSLFSKNMLIGDGAEYIAMYFAIAKTHLPFMTDSAWSAFSAFISSGVTIDIQPVEHYKTLFPALQLGKTSDFPHFFFYPMLAAFVSEILSIFYT